MSSVLDSRSSEEKYLLTFNNLLDLLYFLNNDIHEHLSKLSAYAIITVLCLSYSHSLTFHPFQIFILYLIFTPKFILNLSFWILDFTINLCYKTLSKMPPENCFSFRKTAIVFSKMSSFSLQGYSIFSINQ